MTREDELKAIADWKKNNENRLASEEELETNSQRFFCLTYHCEQTVKDCENRRADHIVYHKSKNGKGRVKPLFVSCVGCLVWKMMPPQKKIRPVGQSGRKKHTAGLMMAPSPNFG